MTARRSSLHVLVPGLLGPLPRTAGLSAVPPVQRLERWLVRATQRPTAGRDLESTLCQLFGVSARQGDFPIASLKRLGRGMPADRRFWFQVEPVCLRPDQSRLLLFDTHDFEVSVAELASLGELFRDHFQRPDWLIEIDGTACWFLSPASLPGVRCRPLGDVFGRNMDLFLPEGEGALAWHALLNEAQMLLFDAEVNRKREAQGQMPINGIWLSGGGCLPDKVEQHYDRIYGVGDLVRGLAHFSDTALLPLPEDHSELLGQAGTGLLIIPTLQRAVWRADPYDWQDALVEFEDWLGRLLAALFRGELAELLLYSCDGRVFHMTGTDRYRFWRRLRPIVEFT